MAHSPAAVIPARMNHAPHLAGSLCRPLKAEEVDGLILKTAVQLASSTSVPLSKVAAARTVREIMKLQLAMKLKKQNHDEILPRPKDDHRELRRWSGK